MTTNHTEEAQNLLDSRITVYGERVTQMERVAKVFSGILNFEVRPDQVPLLMVGYKTVRASQTPDYEDNVKDIEGYALMFREIIGEDMISAVNTDEYLLAKSRREMLEMQGPSKPAVLCKGCGLTLPLWAHPGDHKEDCLVAELNRHNRAYNGRYTDEPTPEQISRLQKEVPSYQPGGGTGANTPHLEVYRQQLADIFQRAWKKEVPTTPVGKWAEIAAREAVEFFWTTFKRNEEFEAAVKEHPTV